MLDKAIRELDRERTGLQSQEKKLIMEIKKMAKEGQMEAVKVMARSLVRNRHAVNKLFSLKSQLQAVSLRVATLKSTHAMAGAMKGATRAMASMNRRMNIPALAKITRDFERQNERMEMSSEVMGDAVDGLFEEGGEEEETDELVGQVLDEIGISLNADLAKVPQAQAAGEPAVAVESQPQAIALGAGGPGAPGRRPPPPGAQGGPSAPPGGGGVAGGLPNAPPPPPPAPLHHAPSADGSGLDDDLQARLDRLRKS